VHVNWILGQLRAQGILSLDRRRLTIRKADYLADSLN
jgi:hypothetical protein